MTCNDVLVSSLQVKTGIRSVKCKHKNDPVLYLLARLAYYPVCKEKRVGGALLSRATFDSLALGERV